MKRIILLIIICFLVGITGCSEKSDSQSGPEELTVSYGAPTSTSRLKGQIETKGDVDIYRVHVNEPGRVVQLQCTGSALRPDVDLLVNVFDANGNMLAGDHAVDGGSTQADIKINLYIDEVKDIYVNVRELLDDEFSTTESYYISASYEGSPDENGTIEDAVTVIVGSDDAVTDSIGFIGDVDCFSFEITENGVYDIAVEFNNLVDTPVRLSMDLYDDSDERQNLDSRNQSSTNISNLIHYLEAGKTYTLLVDDLGRDDSDQASTYSVSVSKVEATNEENSNDTKTSAQQLLFNNFGDTVQTTGALDYYEDLDIFHLQLPAGGSDINVLSVAVTAPLASQLDYNVSIYNLDGVELADTSALFSHDFTGGSTYDTSMQLSPGDYYAVVKPVDPSKLTGSAEYTLTMNCKDVEDADESGAGNEDIAHALTLNVNTSYPAKIAYRGDDDWYVVSVPASATQQVMSVFCDTATTSSVEYALWIYRSDSENTLSEKMFNNKASQIPTKLETAFIVPAHASEPSVYYFKVSDYQGDDGDDVEYTIRWEINDLPTALPANSGPVTGTPTFSDEAITGSGEITVDYYALKHTTFDVNTDFLAAANATTTTNPDDTITVEYDWIGGYIEYKGDNDWYEIEFPNLNTEESNYYYDIEIQLYAEATDVEYVWAFYPDRNDNNTVAFRETGYDGFVASAGDTSILSDTGINITTPGSGESQFWLNSTWGKGCFSISDFNFLETAEGVNNEPDDDWGLVVPYYFKVTLTYHPGVNNP